MIEVYTDAASLGNPGESAVGIFIKESRQHHEVFSYYLGSMSNHEAEFQAVIKALEICQEKYRGEILSIRSDSKIVVETLEKNYTKNKVFQPLLATINLQMEPFAHVFIKWIPEKQNQRADQLARTALQHHSS
ncbi:ribonuclease HI family protein [Thalassobacillus sp. CUG 92003]|uniref:ribonuclease HI family protein n=1 Tax=Thalassobacillus sp. CUG 92003 TaxID=2736641 RepID=UPI0015E721CE